MDTVASRSSLTAPCRYRKDRPLWPGRGVSLTWCHSRMKLSNGSKGARARTRGRGAWCMPECHSHIRCRQRGHFMKAVQIPLKLNQIILTIEDKKKFWKIQKAVLTRYYSQWKRPLWEETQVSHCLMEYHNDSLLLAHSVHPAAAVPLDTGSLKMLTI